MAGRTMGIPFRKLSQEFLEETLPKVEPQMAVKVSQVKKVDRLESLGHSL